MHEELFMMEGGEHYIVPQRGEGWDCCHRTGDSEQRTLSCPAGEECHETVPRGESQDLLLWQCQAVHPTGFTPAIHFQ